MPLYSFNSSCKYNRLSYIHVHALFQISLTFTPAKQNYGAALHNYLSAGSKVSCHYQNDVPQDTWTPDVHKRLIACCSKLGYHTHALILCQLLEPVDYEYAFNVMKSNVGALSEGLFSHLWDMTIIEYLICILVSYLILQNLMYK